MELRNQKIGVIGLGKTGLALVRYLHAQGAEIYVYDDRPKTALTESLKAIESIPAHFELGTSYPESLMECKTWVVSPGVACYKSYLVDARRKGIQTISELDFCAPFIQGQTIAITGSNGKSTTTALIGHILAGWKKNIFVGGNIGTPLVEALGKAYDFIVVEVSSFQLELTEKFKPNVACVLNITPNHQDRHGNMATYKAAKEKLIQNMGKDDRAILNDDDENCRFIGARNHATNWMFSRKNRKHAPIHIENEDVVFFDGRKVSISGFPLLGTHNLENLTAAVAMAVAVDCPKEVIEKQIKTFESLPYRMQNIGEVSGVTFINDAKSTTPDSSIQALLASPNSIIYVAGGRSKGSSYRELGLAAKKKAKKVILFGEAANLMKSDFSQQDVTVVNTLQDAFDLIWQTKEKGDVVLFSPANSSFDQYEGYEKRGEHFNELVNQQKKKAKK